MILVDSSVFIALADRKDQWHTKALGLTDLLDHEPIVISDLIISEVLTVIGKRSGGKAGKQLYDYFIDNCRIIYADEKVLEGAIPVFVKYDGKLSVSDAISVHIMSLKNIQKILSFDSDFDKVEGLSRIF